MEQPVSHPPLFVDGEHVYTLSIDLGRFVIPSHYDHSSRMDVFASEHRLASFHYNNAIQSPHFGTPAHILKPGDVLYARMFRQITNSIVTAEERHNFLIAQGTMFTGAQGASLVCEVFGEQLWDEYWYAPLDSVIESSNKHKPCVYRYIEGELECYFGNPEDAWLGIHCILCINNAT